MKPNDIISAWLAGLSIWALAMLGLVLAQRPEAPVYQEPPSRGIMVEDWYAQGFPDEDEAEAIWEIRLGRPVRPAPLDLSTAPPASRQPAGLQQPAERPVQPAAVTLRSRR